MRGKGHVAHVVVDAQFLHGVLAAVFHRNLVDFAANGVGVFVVVAVAGGRAQQGTHVVVAFKVGVDGGQQLVHGQLLFFKHQLFHGGQRVHNRAKAHVFKVAQVDAFGNLFLVQVDAVLHAQVVHGRAHGLGKVLGTQFVDDILLGKGRLEEQQVLLHIGVPELVPSLEVARVAGFCAQLLVAKFLHAAIAQHHFHRSGKVDVGAARGVGVAVGHAGFGAARNRVIQSFLEGSALGNVEGHDFFVIDELGEARAVLDGFGHVPQVTFGRAGMDAGREVGVVQGEFTLGLEDKVGQRVAGVAAIGGLAANGYGLPVGVAFVESAAGGRDVHVDEFGHAHPHAFQQFHGLGIVDLTFGAVFGVEGEEILIHAAVGNGGAGLLLDAREHLGKPLALAGFPKVAGRFAGHMLGIGGHAQQLGLAGGVGFLFGHFAGEHCVAFGPQHNGFAHDNNGFEEGALFAGVLAAQGIKGVQLVLGFLLDAVETALQDLFKIVHPLDG